MSQFNINTIAKEDAILKAMVSDLAGGFKEIIFPSSYIKELITTGIAYDGSSFQGINTINDSDAILFGVEETIVKCNDSISDIDKKEYWIICNILNAHTKKPHNNCARSKLIELQYELEKIWEGGNLYIGAEPESFFIENRESIDKDKEGNNTNYFNPKDPKAAIITEIQDILSTMGFKIERAHTEVGEDQFEINWRFDRAERTADRIQMYKLICHKVASNYGFDVSFLPKPYPHRNGSGMHCHISVCNKSKNLYYDQSKKSQNYFSDEALKFTTGIMEHARSIAAIGNRTEVSYSRLVPGYEAPCIVAIGKCNRSAACRIPAVADEKILKNAIRTEFRFPDPLSNPYLLAASFIVAGIDGLKKNIGFNGFVEEDLYKLSVKEIKGKGYELLPRNLWEAYQEFDKNKVLQKGLGESISEAYLDLLLEEIDACQPYANRESVRRHYFA